MAAKTIRVGNGAGFWGDNLDAPRRLCESTRLDYLTLEYLAELTMSILAHEKSRDPSAGWVTDFADVIRSLLPSLAGQPGLKIVTNGGGMNPRGCAAAVAKILTPAGLGEIPIGAVVGDDLMPRFDELSQQGERFAHFETGQSLGSTRDRIASVNAYLGAAGIVDALAAGARIVITGRVADASLTVGPAVFEFQGNGPDWSWEDWNHLAAATVAGHLIECGAQCTGGMFSRWDATKIPLSDVGYPIAEISADGRVVITKPEKTGGTVCVDSVAEQLVYEIGDPAHYLTPDVDADFSHVRLAQDGPDRVSVAGAKGNPPPETFKVTLTYPDGFTASSTLVVCGPHAVENARAAGTMILDRLALAGVKPAKTSVEVLGAGDTLPGMAIESAEPWDVVLRVSASDPSRETLDRFVREFAPLVTAGPPGVTGYTGGRARPRPVLAYWPTIVSRSRVTPEVAVQTAQRWTQ